MNNIISIIGRRKTGKTTLIECILGHFIKKGLEISIIKHTGHHFDLDENGRDSHRFRKAGAVSTIITDDNTFALISKNNGMLTPAELAERYMKNSDIVIIEGFKESLLPKIEVLGGSKESPLYKSGVANIQAIVSDDITDAVLPQFKTSEIVKICEFILSILKLSV